MLTLVQICVVVATLAAVAIAVATIRAMVRVDRAMDQFTQLTGKMQLWIVQANELTREARETVASVRGTIAPVRRVVERFETLGERAAGLSAAVLGEVESPLHTSVAVARGVKTGAVHLLKRWSHRFTHGRSATTNGGSDSE
jgi:uncharacterized protein YoxC